MKAHRGPQKKKIKSRPEGKESISGRRGGPGTHAQLIQFRGGPRGPSRDLHGQKDIT